MRTETKAIDELSNKGKIVHLSDFILDCNGTVSTLAKLILEVINEQSNN